MEGITIITPEKKSDRRGWLAELLRREHLEDQPEFGQVYITVARPGSSKGGHYHKSKKEWISVVKGEGEIILEHAGNGERNSIGVNGEKPVTIGIEPGIAHIIINSGSTDLYAVIYSDSVHDPKNPDSYPLSFQYPPG